MRTSTSQSGGTLPKFKIGVMGTPVSSGNRGVLALGAALATLLSRAAPGAEINLLLNHRRAEQVRMRVNGRSVQLKVVNCRLSPRSKPSEHLIWIGVMAAVYGVVPLKFVRATIRRSTPWIGAVSEAALVGDVRGGDSFSDIYGMRRFLLGFLQSWCVLQVRGDLVHFPQTYGPYKSSLAQVLAGWLLRRSSVVIARDTTSQKVAQELVGPSRRVLLSPDVAFALEPSAPEELRISPPEGPQTVEPGTIGININGLMFNGGYTRQNMFGLALDYRAFTKRLLEALLAVSRGKILLIPHTYALHGNVESDNEACALVRASLAPELQARVQVIEQEYDANELKHIIASCDFFLGARMHSCIAALSQGVPCVGIAYSRKFQGVFESVGMSDSVVECRSLTDEEALERCVRLYQERDSVRAELATQAAAARDRLDEVFRYVVSSSVGQGSARAGEPEPTLFGQRTLLPGAVRNVDQA